MTLPAHLTTAALDAGLDEILRSPQDHGRLEMIVIRPDEDARRVIEIGQLDVQLGLLGDNWKTRGSRRTPDGSAHPDKQLNIMNARVIALLAGDPARWALAGDQLFIDLDLSAANLPPGTRLAIGSAVIEVTDQPHTGCWKFRERFGLEALEWVNAQDKKQLNLRGINARVVQAGEIHVGAGVRKINP